MRTDLSDYRRPIPPNYGAVDNKRFIKTANMMVLDEIEAANPGMTEQFYRECERDRSIYFYKKRTIISNTNQGIKVDSRKKK